MKKIRLALFILVLLLLSACATKSGYVRSHPDMDRADRDAFLEGDIKPGFDKEMVRLAKGSPSNITTNTTKSASEEIWLYPDTLWMPLFGTVRSEFTYVYFEDGRVSKIRVISGREKYRENIEKAAGN